MTKIFLINGPAGSGKDTAANYLANTFMGRVEKFAAPLKAAATAIYCNNDRSLFDSFDTFERKGVADKQFHGKTCREVQIAISENFLKPFHSKRVFGDILANKIEADWGAVSSIFVSDSGFREEAESIIERFGAENVVLLRLFRKGHTFEGDSRNYIDLKDLGVKQYDVQNGDMLTFFEEVEDIVASEGV